MDLLGEFGKMVAFTYSADVPSSTARTLRYTAFLDAGLLIAANVLMKTRLPPKPSKLRPKQVLKEFFTSDKPYILYAAG